MMDIGWWMMVSALSGIAVLVLVLLDRAQASTTAQN